MLNWDEYGKEENTTPPAAPEIKKEAVTQGDAVQQSQGARREISPRYIAEMHRLDAYPAPVASPF